MRKGLSRWDLGWNIMVKLPYDVPMRGCHFLRLWAHCTAPESDGIAR